MATLVNYTCKSFIKLTPGQILNQFVPIFKLIRHFIANNPTVDTWRRFTIIYVNVTISSLKTKITRTGIVVQKVSASPCNNYQIINKINYSRQNETVGRPKDKIH